VNVVNYVEGKLPRKESISKFPNFRALVVKTATEVWVALTSSASTEGLQSPLEMSPRQRGQLPKNVSLDNSGMTQFSILSVTCCHCMVSNGILR
jgi:hypothetical protein